MKQRRRSYVSAGIWCSALVAMSGCQAKPANGAAEPAAEVQARVEALKQKTLKDLVQVKGGTFLMGDFGPVHNPDKLPYSGERNDDVLRNVTLDDYAITAHKITYADYDVYTDATGKPKIAQDKMDLEYRNLPDIPAGVNWNEAQSYCRWVGQQIAKKMDLPTEAQWEYAARSGGKMVVWPTDNGKIEDGRNVESFDQAGEFQQRNRYGGYGPTAIGRYPPNPFGLYDMIDHGFEWIRDWYGDTYDPKDLDNPEGPKTGKEKVQRGHSNFGGDSLGMVSMTFTRFSKEAIPPRRINVATDKPSDSNQNAFNTFRCVAETK
ncbi:formylglycine-generating enzyme family protein [Xanthomonas fragariae]|uniref:formylglycine-generating enzyme family protein n=2 Tax=Xanthomonas fragariae TaxID=48664 RepID=UPI000A35CBD5|nr:SUMF1/EgtB/PvdO family nonheme iron enzyme [Xanthomonas fragariae]WIY71244.1 SUMF1/EgtB/PvdO family nonheme iron enzyme [Xanthomonas fragariae]SMQ95689.1 lipoprotein [Xanthomonas fragariae]